MQPNALHAEVLQDLNAQRVVAMVGFEAQFVIRCHRVVAGVLKLVGHQLVHQADAAPFLQVVDQDAGSGFGNRFLRHGQLGAAVATAGSEDIARQTLGVNAHKGGFRLGRIPHHQSNSTVGLVAGFETEDPKVAEFRREGRFGNLDGIHARKYSTRFRLTPGRRTSSDCAALAVGSKRSEAEVGSRRRDLDRVSPGVGQHEVGHVLRMQNVA